MLSDALGRNVSAGRIIYGKDHATLRVNTSALVGDVKKSLEKIAALLSNPTPPDLVLNRHCAACEYQTRCRQKAIEKDDLSLLAGMSEKERKKFHRKGKTSPSLCNSAMTRSGPRLLPTATPRQTREISPLVESARNSGEEDPHRR